MRKRLLEQEVTAAGSPELRNRTIHALFWASSAKILNQSFSWLVTILLARLLLPADFGIIALAWIFVGFLDLINELGIGAALIQKKDLDRESLCSIFWFSVLTGLFFYGLAFLLAPTIAHFFDNEQLTQIVRALSLVFVIGSFKTVPFSLLTKELDFSKRSVAELLSVFLGGICSVILAILEYGVWSLVYGTLLRNGVLTVTIFFIFPWRPKLIFFADRIRQIISFGASVIASRALWYFYSHCDTLFVGKSLGNQMLGFYSMAFQLATMPVQKITAVTNQVAFPAFSKLQDDEKSLNAYFLKITQSVSLLTFPLMAGLFIVSEDLVYVFLTEKWLPIIVPLKALCIIGLLKSIDSIIPPLLMAKGKPQINLRYNFLCLAVLPIAFFTGVQYGINGVVLAWCIAYPLLLVYLFRSGLSILHISFYMYMRNLFPSIAASAFMAGIVLFFQAGYNTLYGQDEFFILIGSFLLGGISYFGFFLMFYKDIFIDIYRIFSSYLKGEGLLRNFSN